MHAQPGPSQNSCWLHETFFPRSHTAVSSQDLEKMHSWQQLPHEGPGYTCFIIISRKKLEKISWGFGVTGALEYRATGWDWAEVAQNDCGLYYTVATGASQGTAALHCTVGMTEASRGSCSFVLCCRSGAFCCPRAAAHQETLQCRVANSPGDVWFWFFFFLLP